MAEMRTSQSLWGDAWRRLRHNKAAMVGLVIVTLMSLLAITADWIIPYESDYGQPWIRAQAPGYTHPAVLAENRFEVGKKPLIPVDIPGTIEDAMTDDGPMVYTAHQVATREYRIRLRRGKVRQIQRMEGAIQVDRLEVAGERQALQVLGAENDVGPVMRDLLIEKGQAIPAVFGKKKGVLLVRVTEPLTPKPERIVVEFKDGTVTSITRDEKVTDRLALEGRYIQRVEKNGEELTLHHWLGTDLAGRDVLSRVIYGARISLMVGAVATVFSVTIGVIYGAIAGYMALYPLTGWGVLTGVLGLAIGGLTQWSSGVFALALMAAVVIGTGVGYAGRRVTWGPLHRPITTVGEFMMRVVDILYALPFMFLVILLMISFGRDILTLFIALGCVQWLMMARIVRGQVLSLKEKEFVEAARMSGTGPLGIIFRHLIPNTLGVVVVYATLTIPAVILQESFLAFIGLTVEMGGRTLDSWGSLVDQGRKSLTSSGGNWWVLVYPSLAMAVTLFSLNFLGDGLRDALDPQLKGKG